MSTACFIFKIPREHIGPSFSQMSTPTEWASGVELAWIRRGELTKARWRHGPGAQRWGQRWVWTGSKVIHPKWWKGNVGTKLFTYLVLLLFGFVSGRYLKVKRACLMWLQIVVSLNFINISRFSLNLKTLLCIFFINLVGFICHICGHWGQSYCPQGFIFYQAVQDSDLKPRRGQLQRWNLL